jgi:hypothetical protein
MAEVKTIKIDVDTKQAVNAMENLSKATNDVNKSFEEVYGDLQPLTTRMGEAEDRLYELANAGQTASQEYQDLLETVGRYRKVQIQTDMAVDAAATTMSQKLGGALGGVTAGFELTQGVMGAFGAESEQVEKALLKVQSAMAIAQGVQGFREAIPAFQALKTSIVTGFTAMTTASRIFMSVGILAIVSAIVYLATEVKAVTRVFEDFTDWLGFTDNAAKRNAKAIEDNAKRVAAANERVNASNRKRAEASAAAYDNEIAMAQIAGKDTTKLEIEKSQNQSQAARERYNNALKEYEKLKGQNSKFAVERRKELKEQLDSERTFLRDERYAREQARAQASADRKEAYKEAKADRTAAQNEAARNAIEFENELNSRLEQVAEQNYLNSLSEQDKEIRLVQDKYFELETLAEGNADALREIEIAKLNEINDINLKYQQEAYDLDKEAAEKKKELDEKSKQERIEAEKAVAETLATIRQQDFNNIEAGLDLISSLFENNKKVQAAVLVAENAVGIAKTIMNTQAANQLARAQGTALAIASGGASVAAAEALVVRNNIGAGISIASQIAATAKGLSALKAGGAPASGSISDGGGGGGGVMSPSFNVVGNSGMNQLAQIQQQPIQAYVVSGEVTSAQALDRNRIKNATL